MLQSNRLSSLSFCIAAFLAIWIPTIVFAVEKCPELTTLQKAAGFVSWEWFIQLLAIGLGTVGFWYLTRGIFAKFLQMKKLIDFLIYMLTFVMYFWPLGLLVFSIYIPVEFRLWGSLSGALLFPGSVSLFLTVFKKEFNQAQWSGFLAIVWWIAAVAYSSPEIGFLAVGALLSLLGFSVAVDPFCYAFGFDSKKHLLRGTVAGLMISTVYLVLRIFGFSESFPVRVFQDWALWLGAFVGFCGLLIASSKWYAATKREYVVNQILMIGFSLAFLSFGMLFAVRELTTIVGIFFILYLAAKPIEIKPANQTMMWALLLCSSMILAAVWYFIRSNPELVTKYLSL